VHWLTLADGIHWCMVAYIVCGGGLGVRPDNQGLSCFDHLLLLNYFGSSSTCRECALQHIINPTLLLLPLLLLHVLPPGLGEGPAGCR
jgi:hypothetical protein